jgi:surface carbohydrate biosynthesis protein (TIGR04326 family)
VSVNFLLATRRQRPPASFGGHWLYFGENWADMRRWEKRLPNAQRVSCAAMLTPTFLRLKPALIQWIAALGKQFDYASAWWLTALAGKNVMWTPFFLHVCYLEILSQLRGTFKQECLIVCDDWWLLRAIEANLHAAGCSTRRVSGWRIARMLEQLLHAMKFGYRWWCGLRDSLTLLAVARWTRAEAQPAPVDPSRPHALMHTCVDETCFGADELFVDRYYGSLATWLEKKGYVVTVLPWLFNSSRPPLQAYRWFRRNRRRFLLPEDFVKLHDYLDCIRQIFAPSRLLQGRFAFQSIDVSALVGRERRESMTRVALIKFLLYQPALKRWTKLHGQCALFIDLFENHAPERPQVKALRACSPATRIVGYQHGAASPPEFLPYSITADEWNCGIFPDRIVCSGNTMAKYLRAGGFPENALAAGPALRYSYIFSQPAAAEPAPRRSGVLAIFPLEASAAAEMMESMLASVESLRAHGAGVRLRQHPMMTCAKLLQLAGRRQLPENWYWADAPLLQELQGAAVVVGLGTNAQFDAAAMATPVICLARELGFSYNYLDEWSDEFPVCRTVMPGDLAQRLDEILGDTDFARRARLEELSATMLLGLGKTEDDSYEAFLGQSWNS